MIITYGMIASACVLGRVQLRSDSACAPLHAVSWVPTQASKDGQRKVFPLDAGVGCQLAAAQPGTAQVTQTLDGIPANCLMSIRQNSGH